MIKKILEELKWDVEHGKNIQWKKYISAIKLEMMKAIPKEKNCNLSVGPMVYIGSPTEEGYNQAVTETLANIEQLFK